MRAYTDRADGVQLVTDPPRRGTPAPPDVALSDDDLVPAGLRAWAGRATNGFYVQGLVAADGSIFISAGIPGRGLHETFEVKPEDAAEAFEHPFAYGCTLPL